MITSLAERAVLRTVVDRIDLGVLEHTIDHSLSTLPHYESCGTGTQLTDQGTPMIRWNLELFIRWLCAGVAPNADQVARLRGMIRDGATRGKRLQDQLIVYNRGTQALWEVLLQNAADDERAVLVSYSALVLDYQNLVLEVFTDAYAAQEDAPASTDERRAGALLDWLVGPDPLDIDGRLRATRLEFPLAGAYRPFVATLAGASISEHVDLARRLRNAGALAVTKADRINGLTEETFDWRPHLADRRLVLSVDRLTQRPLLAAAFDDLRAVVAVACGTGLSGRVGVDEFLPQLLLRHSPRVADRLVQRVYGPLADRSNDDLVVTMKTLAAHNFDRAATAAALPAHRNTLLYRINRIQEITELDLHDPRDLTTIWLASQWADRNNSHQP